MTDTPANANPATAQARRRRQLFLASGVCVLAGLVWLAQWYFVGRLQVSTNDAYVSGNIVQVTPQTPGTVVAINVEDNDRVDAGQALVRLDDSDARVALEQAQAQLAQTVREVRALFNGNQSLRARITLQETVLQRAQSDLQRRQGLDRSGAVSSEELHHSEAAVQAAEADLLAAREDLSANESLTEGTSISEHPQVRAAAARVRAAYLALQRTSIPAALAGHISRRSVQLGQQIAPGTPLMAIIPLEDVWVDANFKESQLAHIRIGQPVTLTADLYGSQVTYRGTVQGLSAGTGSAFSLLPPQNATGNWIKVVQRVPVRITLDAQQLQQHPLRLGLSMVVDVDISDTSGAQLIANSNDHVAYETRVYDDLAQSADNLVEQIIQANSGSARTSQPESGNLARSQ